MKKLLALLISACMLIASPVYAASLPKKSVAVWRAYGVDRGGTSLALSFSRTGSYYNQYHKVFVADGYNRLQDALCAVPYIASQNGALILQSDTLFKDDPHYIVPSGNDLMVNIAIMDGGGNGSFTWVTGGITPPSWLTAPKGVPATNFQNFAGDLSSQDLALKFAEALPDPNYLFIVNEQSYADALSITPYAAYTHSPILYVNQNSVSQSVLDYIAAHQSTLKQIYIIGGTAVISDAVKNQFPNSVRIAGYDRYGTCLKTNMTLPPILYKNAKGLTYGVMNGENYALGDGISTAANITGPSVFWLTPGANFPYSDQNLTDCWESVKNGNSNVTPSTPDFAVYLYAIGGPAVLPDSVINNLIKSLNTMEGY